MKYNNLEKLVDGQFEHLVNLEELDLSQNQLKAIPEMAFHGLDELIKLELNDNHIDKIYSNCFNNLSQLNELYLSRNQLNYIPEETFHGLNKLEQLELDSNDIDRMHSGCFKVFPHLARLNLSSNKIQHLNKVHLFENFKNIALLDLSNNQVWDKLAQWVWISLSYPWFILDWFWSKQLSVLYWFANNGCIT